MIRDPTLCRSFVRQAKAFLSKFPQVEHAWSVDADEDNCILELPKSCDDGFTVTVEVYPDGIMITAEGGHTQLDLDADADDLVARTLGLVRDLLSPAMRIRECLAGGMPYKWAFELCQDGQWVTKEWVGLFFFNYFGKRTEKTYQNSTLPPRG